MLRRCSRLQRSQVQTCRPLSTPSAQLRRTADTSAALSPHVSQTGRAVSSFIRPVSTRGPFSDGILHRMLRILSEPDTSRLELRQWREEDRTPFARLNADPMVMAHFPALLTRDESDALMDRCVEDLARRGYGLWAVRIRATSEFIGFVGLAVPTWDAPITPCTEIGWRLARSAWGQGYATEAADAVLATAFGLLGLDRLVSFTTAQNLPSQRVMQRIGMTRSPSEDFEHPRVPDGPLRRQVLYRLSKADWERRQGRQGLAGGRRTPGLRRETGSPGSREPAATSP